MADCDNCRLCGDSYNTDGDGYDGFCPNCADRLDSAGFWDDGDSERNDPAEYLAKHGKVSE